MEVIINRKLFLGAAGLLSQGDLVMPSCPLLFPSFLTMLSLGITRSMHMLHHEELPPPASPITPPPLPHPPGVQGGDHVDCWPDGIKVLPIRGRPHQHTDHH